MCHIPPKMIDRIKSELKPAEEILWMGSPDRRIRFRKYCVVFGFLVLSSVFLYMWLSEIHLFWASEATYLLILAGALCVVFPLMGRFSTLSNTVYAVTNIRVLSIWGRNGYSIRSLYPPDLKKIVRRMETLSRGTLILNEEYTRECGDICVDRFEFRRIENVKKVHSVIEQMIQDNERHA